MILTNLFLSYSNMHKSHSAGHPETLALLGLVCGYPMGAKICADLVKNDRITPSVGNYLLPLCNLAGPSFISGFVITHALHMEEQLFICLACIYVPIILYAICSLLVRRPSTNAGTQQSPVRQLGAGSLDQSIMDSFAAVTKLGGYIILFAILSEFLMFLLPAKWYVLNLCLYGILEITNGISRITDSILSHPHQIMLSLSFVNFGGLSCMFQTGSMIRGSGLSIMYYLLSKCTIAILTGIIAYILFC